MTDEYKKIVVIDDSAASLALYARAVETLNVILASFQSSEDGYFHLKQQSADLIFMGNLIHGTDGLELLKRIRELEQHCETPIIILSSKDYDQDRLLAQERGASDYLIKPVPTSIVREMITRYTGAQARSD